MTETELENIIKENDKFRPRKDMFNGKYPYLVSDQLGKNHDDDKELIVIEEMIPNLSIEETTDVNHLFELNQKIDYKLREVISNQSSKYTPKTRKIQLLVIKKYNCIFDSILITIHIDYIGR